jgi:hypothetical protein
VEGAVVRGLIAQIEEELLFRIVWGTLGVEAGSLEGGGTLGEPIVLRHFLDQDLFGDYQVSILEVAGSASTHDDILLMENRWKMKLRSREMGLNRN